MWKKLLWVKNLVFLVGFSFLSAKIIQAMVLSHIFAYEPPLLERAQPTSELYEQVKSSLDTYAVISGRNVFNSNAGKDNESGTSEEEQISEPIEESELNVVLLGTAVGSPEDTFAVIKDSGTREQELYQVGDMVKEEAQIVKVSRCRVVLKRDGGREVLECIEPDERHRPVNRRTARRQRASDPGIKRVSKNRYLIDEARVESALANVNRLMTQIRVVPNLRGGRGQGWKVFAIRPNSIFADVGLKNGDVIQRVNGRNISSMKEAYQAFQDLRDARDLNVEILRRGRRQTLNYEIR
jgi:general secretion pathway protein C